MLTLDTSGIVAIMNRRDRYHARALAAVADDPGPYVVPAAILSEVGYLLETTSNSSAVVEVLRSLESGAMELDGGEGDVRRIRELVEKYADLHLGVADAAVVACAERHGGSVLTFDRRDFDVVARGEGTIVVVPSFAG